MHKSEMSLLCVLPPIPPHHDTGLLAAASCKKAARRSARSFWLSAELGGSVSGGRRGGGIWLSLWWLVG